MGSVYQILRDSLPFPMVEVWRNAQEEILRFKNLDNAVLFAAGACWEGVDFPGDIVSSLIIVKLPFAVPDPLSEAEKEKYDSLPEYIQDIIVPDMQKKLRQGFGRAIRTESDTCVVTILDHRAVAGGRYHEDVLRALPVCQMAEDIEDVKTFIRRQKNVEYYM
jgi:ATP-dependent DNA helicase DinG